METYASFYYIRWKAIFKRTDFEWNVKHRGETKKHTGDMNSNVNRENTSTKYTKYISNTICKHNALRIRMNNKKNMIKVVLKYY